MIEFSATDIKSRLEAIGGDFPLILEIGRRHGLLTRELKNPNNVVIATDIGLDFLAQLKDNVHLVNLDEELLPLKESIFDLVVSNLNLHWINDIMSFLLQVKKTMKQDAVFIASFFGGTTLYNLRRNFLKAEVAAGCPSYPHISPFIRADQINAILQHIGFCDIVVDSNIVTVEYGNILTLMRDLKNMGENAAFFHSNNYALSRKVITRLQDIYSSPFEEQFEIITATAVK